MKQSKTPILDIIDNLIIESILYEIEPIYINLRKLSYTKLYNFIEGVQFLSLDDINIDKNLREKDSKNFLLSCSNNLYNEENRKIVNQGPKKINRNKVLEDISGIKITNKMHVHHKDLNRKNNKISNFLLLTKSGHINLHKTIVFSLYNHIKECGCIKHKGNGKYIIDLSKTDFIIEIDYLKDGQILYDF